MKKARPQPKRDRALTQQEAERLANMVLPVGSEHDDEQNVALIAIIHLLAYDDDKSRRDVNAYTLLIALYDQSADHDAAFNRFMLRAGGLLGEHHHSDYSPCYKKRKASES